MNRGETPAMESAERMRIVAGIVEEACAAEANAFGYGIWTHHIVPVVRYGRQLAALLGANAEVVELAALLHDYASVRDMDLYAEHHVHGPRKAEELLRTLETPDDLIGAVSECIACHRASVPQERRTPEAICLASADGMAHITEAPSLLYLAFVRWQMDIAAGTQWVLSKMQRSWDKLCPEAQAIVRAKYEAATLMLGGNRRSNSEQTFAGSE